MFNPEWGGGSAPHEFLIRWVAGSSSVPHGTSKPCNCGVNSPVCHFSDTNTLERAKPNRLLRTEVRIKQRRRSRKELPLPHIQGVQRGAILMRMQTEDIHVCVAFSLADVVAHILIPEPRGA